MHLERDRLLSTPGHTMIWRAGLKDRTVVCCRKCRLLYLWQDLFIAWGFQRQSPSGLLPTPAWDGGQRRKELGILKLVEYGLCAHACRLADGYQAVCELKEANHCSLVVDRIRIHCDGTRYVWNRVSCKLGCVAVKQRQNQWLIAKVSLDFLIRFSAKWQKRWRFKENLGPLVI